MKERLTAVKELVRRVLPWAGFPVFYVFCLLLFFTWTFPFDRLKERIVLGYNAQQRAGGSQQELQVDDLSSSWITGLKLHGVRLISPSSDPTKPRYRGEPLLLPGRGAAWQGHPSFASTAV